MTLAKACPRRAVLLPMLAAGLVPPFAGPARAQRDEVGSADRPARVGVTTGPHARVMERVRDLLARGNGPALRVVEFPDYTQCCSLWQARIVGCRLGDADRQRWPVFLPAFRPASV